jgi:hypothetical protein
MTAKMTTKPTDDSGPERTIADSGLVELERTLADACG